MTKNILLWIVLVVIWSSSFLAIKVGIETMGPLTLVAVRMVIGTSVMLIVLRSFSLSLPKDMRSWGILFVCGMMGNIIPFSLISFGELNVDSGLAALLMGIAPVATVLFAPLVHRDEELSLGAIAGIAIGVLGLVVLIGPEALKGLGSQLSGQAAILGAALCYAFTTLFVRRFAALPALVMAAGSMLTGTVVIVGLAYTFETPPQEFPVFSRSLIAALYLGLFPTALATLIYFYLVPRLGAGRVSQINFVVPLGGTIFGVIFLGESLRANALAALFLIMTAVFLVTRKGSKKIPIDQ